MPTSVDELKFTSITRIAGQNEDYAADVTSLNEMKASDILDNGALYSVLTLTTAGVAYELKVGGSVKADRKAVEFIAEDNGIYYGYSNAVTTSTGKPCFKDQMFVRSYGPNTSVWFVATTNNAKVRISEI
jgi:hypothetical protein